MLLEDLRARLAPGVRILAPDSFAGWELLKTVAGPAAEGMTVSGRDSRSISSPLAEGVSVPTSARSSASVRLPSPSVPLRATEVLLNAIARSDGTRASVTREPFRTKVTRGLIGSSHR
jgi:hypothetical protein